jgi:ABC-2 type transport system permease protein
MFFEKMAPMHLQSVVLSLFVFMISILTIGEGIYKTGPLLFNCKDDQLLLSLPIKKSTVLFIRIFKFYVFELAFNSLLLIPLAISYLRWADSISWTFYLSTVIMLFILPIIPIVLSCIIGTITTALASRFKLKNLAQIIVTTIMLLGIFYISMNFDGFLNDVAKHATSLNDLITKIYYPAGIYARLSTDFNWVDLLVFVGVNILIYTITVSILSKFYFKINSRLKKVTSTKKTNINKLTIKQNSPTKSLIKKEFTTFFKTPVFIVNAGFGLVLFIAAAILVSIKFNSVIPVLTDPEKFNLEKDIIINNVSLICFILIAMAGFMTSITNSVISLEGKNISILKSLPIKAKTILMSKIYSSLIITTPPILIGDLILFIRFRLSIIEMVLLLILSILIPLTSHFIGIIVNLKYPKLDWENQAEVVKQSTSSFVAVMTGMLLLVLSAFVAFKLIGVIPAISILIIITILFIIIDSILYLYLDKIGTKQFNKLSV